jgi:polyribonucleotide nucleotidyltransferase
VTDATMTAVAKTDSAIVRAPRMTGTSTEPTVCRRRRRLLRARRTHTTTPPPPRGGDPTPPAVTSIVRGVVTSVRPFGVFVRPVGKARDGLVHCTQVSEELTFTREDSDDAKQMAMEYFFPKGTEVWVKVLDVTVEGGAGTGGYADPSTLGLGDPPRV